MLLCSRCPAPPLDRLVEELWYFEDLETPHLRERRLPDAGMGLIIDLGESPKKLYDRDDLSRCTNYRRAWISGMQRRYIVIGSEPGSSLIGARLRTGAAAALFNFPLSELSGSVVELDLLWKQEILTLRQRLLEAEGAEARFDLLEAFLRTRLRTTPRPDRAVHAALARLRSWPVLRLKGLAAELGLTQRQMIARFDAQVGLTPKVVSRLFRFHKALVTVHGAEADAVDWAALAVDCGYFDQAHLIHEFREFAGVTPAAYAAARTPYPFYLYLD